MKTLQWVTAFAAIALLALPAAASADLYYYAPNTTSGAFNYGSSLSNYIPASAMPYVELGQQMQQQNEGYSYPSYSYPSEYQSQSQSQYESSYPSYAYGYSEPSYEYSYEPTSDYSYGYNQYGEYSTYPESYSYPVGTTGPLGTEMCYWSDYPTYAPCGTDPQQWVQDPYTGGWY